MLIDKVKNNMVLALDVIYNTKTLFEKIKVLCFVCIVRFSGLKDATWLGGWLGISLIMLHKYIRTLIEWD